MIDLRATKEAYDSNTIALLGHILRELNIADSMTRIENNSMMQTFMAEGTLNIEINQYVVKAAEK